MQAHNRSSLPEIGSRFGRWTVIREVAGRPTGSGKKIRCFLCRCECGNEKEVLRNSLIHGKSKSCGCLPKRIRREPVVGERFGQLVVVEPIHHEYDQFIYTKFLCDCGTEKVSRFLSVAAGQIISCGCVSRQRLDEGRLLHGRYGTPEYHSWHSMKQRCGNPNNLEYHNYGGRGITYDPDWESFENFYKDMGDRPSPEYSLERLNVNEGYNAANCTWATVEEQIRNRRISLNLTHDGVTHSLAEWSRLLGIPYNTVAVRFHAGQESAEVLSTQYPRKPRHRKQKASIVSVVESMVPPPPLTGTCAESVPPIDGAA